MTSFNEAEPLTYDKLNQMIIEINRLKGLVNNITSGNNSNQAYPLIDVILESNGKETNLNRSNKIQVFAGTTDINITNTTGNTIDGDNRIIRFNNSFNSIPIVICTIGANDFDNVTATVQISNVKRDSFKYKIVLSNTPNSLKTITLNYIAIGRDA